MPPATSRRVQIWGGIECTVNRVQDRFRNQLRESGHDRRVSDLDLLAGLNLSRLRYPVLWELVAPSGFDQLQWHWTDERLNRLRELGIEPIAGLLHHGSGPSYTSLIDPNFPALFARYAELVAQRYPWLEHFTPINEPLTTARFSGLYGLWYPHARNDRAFARALMNEIVATVLAMERIRKINPRAQLIQTDDLGETFSTPLLRYQADFDNTRRWLGWDLLCGRVDRQHPMRAYLEGAGIEASELDWLVDHPCPPDVIGINHYVTSDRMLHEDVARFPPHTHGGNGRHRYADTEAVRALPAYEAGFARVIDQAAKRYGLPIALTEVHLACSREEQLRWLQCAWQAANEALDAGVPMLAITPWALLGSYDWNSLLTVEARHYESGAFDVSSGKPRPTALVSLIRSMAADGSTSHTHLLNESGWWQRPARIHSERSKPSSIKPRRDARTLLITGGGGTLANALLEACEARGLRATPLSRVQLDIWDERAVTNAIQSLKPWAIVNAAGVSKRGIRHGTEAAVQCVNPATLARACASSGLPFVTFSSEAVFDGTSEMPYDEASARTPVDARGEACVRAELDVQREHPTALIIRSSCFIAGLHDRTVFNEALMKLARAEPVAVPPHSMSPTYVVDLAQAALNLLIDAEQGVWHVVNQGAVTWRAVLEAAASQLDISTHSLSELESAHSPGRNFALTSQRGFITPPLEDALARFARSAHESLAQMRRAGRANS